VHACLRVYKCKNAQVVTSLQTSCYMICLQAVNKLCSHCLFPVVVTSLEQAVNKLDVAVSDLLQDCSNKSDTVKI
jgi:hypothetical protein